MPYSFPIDPDNTSRTRRRTRSQQVDQIDIKSLGARIGSVRFDPNAEDGDGDGLVQDNTMYERPALPSMPQGNTGGLSRTAEGTLKRQSELTPDEVRDIERARLERSLVAGLRSSVAKPTGGLVPSIQIVKGTDSRGRTVERREIVPHPSIPNPSRLDWLKDMSDDEIAVAVVPQSLSDLAVTIVQNSYKKYLLGARLSDEITPGVSYSAELLDFADSLERIGVSTDVIQKVRSFAYRKYSREGNFSAEDLYQELTDYFDASPELFKQLTTGESFTITRLQTVIGNTEKRNAKYLEDLYVEMMDFLEQDDRYVSEGFTFTQTAIDEARRVVKEALSTSDSFGWAVRTYGMPTIRVVTPESSQLAKTAKNGRAQILNEYPGGWFGHGGEWLHGIAINLSEKTTAQNLPSGPINMMDSSPIGGFPADAIPGNVSYSQADVLRHEWGHFFFYMLTRRGAQEAFLNAGWTTSEWDSVKTGLVDKYHSGKGNLYKKVSDLRRQRVMLASDFLRLIDDPLERSRAGITEKDAETAKLIFHDDMVRILNSLGLPIRSKRMFPYNDLAFMTLVAELGQMAQAQDGSVVRISDAINTKNPLFNLWAVMSMNPNNTFTMSAYGFSEPQESWAEGMAAFFSPKPEVRALNSNGKRLEIANSLKIDIDPQTGRHDKPWERTSSGLVSPTEGNVPERENMPEAIESEEYPKEIGGMRSRIALDKRAENLGVDISLFNDSSRDSDDVMWSTNDWSISKTDRVEAGDAVIVREGENGPEVLMVTRSKGPFLESLALPGGMREGEEPLDRSAMREAMEEVGINASSALNSRLLGEIDTRDWDPRFVEGGRIAGVRMDVGDDVVPQVGDDATSYQWVPVSSLANGRHSIAFGHAAWIAEAFRDDSELYEKLSIISEASRVRNRRIIASVDRERAKKGAKRFGPLPDPNAPYPTVYPERRLGMRSTTQSGVPYSVVRRNDENIVARITELRTQKEGITDRINKLRDARKNFNETGAWNGADIGVAMRAGNTPINVSKEDIESRNWKDIIAQDVDEQIDIANQFSSQTDIALNALNETLTRRVSSSPLSEEFDDIRSDRKTYSMLEAATRDLAGMGEDVRRNIFNRGGDSYVVALGDQPEGFSKAINLYRVNRPADEWNGLFEDRTDGELVSILSFTQSGKIDSLTESTVAPILEGWAKNAVNKDVRSRSSRGLSSSTRETRISGRNFEEVFDELELTEQERNIARIALEDSAEDFSTGAIFDRPIHEALDADRERLLNSIRIEVDEDGIPMLIADPNPLFFQFVPDKRDWSKVRLPSEGTIEEVKQILQDSQNEDREVVRSTRSWDSLYTELLDKITSIPGSRKYKPKNEGNFLELYVAGLNDPRATMIGEAGDIVVHDSFGHVGIGRGFDRHGEWANFLSTVSVVKAANPEQMSDEEKDSVLRNSLINYGVTQLTKNGANYMEWMNLVNQYDGDILDIIELLDTSDRTQVLNNDGSRPAGMRSRTGGEIIPVGQAPKSTLNTIADTDALRSKRLKQDENNGIRSNSGMLSQTRRNVDRDNKIVDIYLNSEMTIRQIAEQEDLSLDVVTGILKWARKRGEISGKRKGGQRGDDRETLVRDGRIIDAYLNTEIPISQIARQEGMSLDAVTAVLRYARARGEISDKRVSGKKRAQTVQGSDKSLQESYGEIKSLNYTKPELRERLKRNIMAGDKGGRPGQWSARKAQLLAQAYRKAGGGYRGGVRKTQRSLKRWTREKWTTSDGKPANRPGGMRRYLPAKAWSRLTPTERRATNRKKIEGSRRGNQFVRNTQKARTVGRNVRKSRPS